MKTKHYPGIIKKEGKKQEIGAQLYPTEEIILN